MKQDKRSALRLEKAIRAGDLAKVRELIAAGIDVATASDDGSTPIQLAAREGQITIVRALAGAGAELAELEALGLEERLKLFLESSKDDLLDDDLITIDELAEWAMQASLQVFAENMDDELRAEIAAHEGALFRAVRTGDIELLKKRIVGGDGVDPVAMVTGETPLTMAIRRGDVEMVGELIRSGADVNHPGFSTPLSFALPDLRLMKLLLDAGANVHQRGMDIQSAFERAVNRVEHPTCSDDSILLVRFFLEAGAHPPEVDRVEGSLLMDLELGEAWELFQELLPHYPDEVAGVNLEELQSSFGIRELDDGMFELRSELEYAAGKGDVEGLRKALARCQGKDVAEPAGLALRTALSVMEIEAARVLIDAGADLDAVKDYEKRRGSTPLACAAESWHRRSKEMMRWLLDKGADVDGRGRDGRTPLMYAVLVAYRHGAALRKAVPVLLEAGADLALEDAFGFTAWSLAKAPLIEDQELSRLAAPFPDDSVLFDGPDLSDLFSAAANAADRRQSRLDRCRETLDLLEAAGAKPHREAELRLLVAATAGDAGRVAELLASGADVDAPGADGDTAIAAAARGGHGKVVSRLVAAGCKVDASKAGEPSALEIAVRAGDPVMTRALIDGGANVFMLVAMSREALEAAEAAGADEVVKMVRDALPPEVSNFDREAAAESAADDLAYDSQRALPGQAALGDLDKVRELLAVPGVEVDGFDALRRTALMAAAEAGHHDVVRELIAAGADVDRCNGVVGSPRSTPLACAAICSSAERDGFLRLLLEAGADPDRLGADGRTALMHAVERDVGFFGRVGEPALSTRTLIDAGADLEIRDPYGLTAWMRACSLATAIPLDEVADQYEVIAELLEDAGASTEGHREIDLIWAVLSEELDEARSLLEAGTDPNTRRFDGATALMLAVRDGHRDLARLLIDAGCDLDARQWLDRGPRAIDAAAAARDQTTYQMLIAAGANPPDPDGRRPDSPSPFLSE